ncbi:MAG TPA: triose-phosphate isomerase [Candidatus Moranbacteria bacterium]|nr:triose-phosphate isomerase [Candidatus Moranbacteria bacterium]
MQKEREKIMVANFKMNPTSVREVDLWIANFKKTWKDKRATGVRIVLCPPVLFLERLIKNIKFKNIEFGAQNCFWEKKGAFTGEISAAALYSVGAQFVILGHSEQRKYFGEGNQRVNLKLQSALTAGLDVVLCIGETAAERAAGRAVAIVKKQLAECLKNISPGKLERVIICYEPVWAISANGPAKLPEPDEILQMKLIIKKYLVENFSRSLADKVAILYGGSVDSKNAREVCVEPMMDGALVGSASLFPHDFVRIAEILEN